jgi:hypothetical protein
VIGAVRLQTVPNSSCRVLLLPLGYFARVLNALDARLRPELTSPARFCYISTMKVLIQTGSSGWVTVPPEKRFLINTLRADTVNDGAVFTLIDGRG